MPTYAAPIFMVPTAHSPGQGGAVVNVPFEVIDSNRGFTVDMKSVLWKNGVDVEVHIINAGIYGRHFRPQPFMAAGLVAPEVWGDFQFPPATVGIYYREQWYCENQNHPLVFSLLSGSLPPGLVLTNLGSTAEGQVDGIPTALGTYTFTLRAVGPTLIAADKSFSIDVGSIPVSGFV